MWKIVLPLFLSTLLCFSAFFFELGELGTMASSFSPQLVAIIRQSVGPQRHLSHHVSGYCCAVIRRYVGSSTTIIDQLIRACLQLVLYYPRHRSLHVWTSLLLSA
jgi:hypothetical protein